MSDERADLILEHTFGPFLGEIGDIKTSMVEVKGRSAFSKRDTPAFRAESTGSTAASNVSSAGSISSA